MLCKPEGFFCINWKEREGEGIQ